VSQPLDLTPYLTYDCMVLLAFVLGKIKQHGKNN
jgi:hypothetical protein